MARYLDAFTVAKTHLIDEMRSALVDVYDARRVDLPQRSDTFSAEAAYFDFGSSSLSYCSYGSPLTVTFREDDYVRIQVGLAGRGRTWLSNRTSEISSTKIVCSEADANLEFGHSLEQFAHRIKRSQLDRDATSLLGFRPKDTISFDWAVDCEAGHAARLRNLILQAVSNIDASKEPVPTALLREMDQTIRIAALYGIPNNLSGLLHADTKPAAPWQVRRIEEWIDANWQSGISIEKLAEVSGASVRSIFATFRSARDYTPMAYLKRVRLNAARDMLLKATPDASVTLISLACSFMNPSHFARDYRLQFGELPSDTLRRAKLHNQ